MSTSPIEEYKYLWDGSQPGWSLLRIYSEWVELTLKFAPAGPSSRELLAVRKTVDGFKAMSLGDVAARLAGQSNFWLGKFESGEARAILNECNQAGLTVQQQVSKLPPYLLTNVLTNRALVIEDDEMARRVVEAALLYNLPIRHVEA